jgi:hypothetical protein
MGMPPRSIALGLIATTVLIAGGTAIFLGIRSASDARRAESHVMAAKPARPESPLDQFLSPADRERLPADLAVREPAETAECRGLLVSGQSKWGVESLREKNVLWDENKRQLVVILPGKELSALQAKMTPK